MRTILIGAGILLLVTGAVTGYIVWRSMQESVTPLVHLNPASSGARVLIVYSPGVSDFHERVTDAFASGLAESGWSVDVVTASREATIDFAGYDLLVLGGPIHGGKPSKPVLDYIDRVQSLNGLRVYVVLTSIGGPPSGESLMSEWVTVHGGQVEGFLSLSTSKNPPVDGLTDPTQIASAAAQKISK